MTDALTLHGYWRSSASYRVRIALNLKQRPYAQQTYDLRTGIHRGEAFRAIAPQALVPALDADGVILTQSPAILEWIEESWPKPPLLPSGANDRAIVRAMAALIGCDVHPLNNLRVLKALRGDFAASEDQVQAWIHRWINDGFDALEQQIAQYGDGWCFGDTPGIADCYLIPQAYGAVRFGIDLARWPHLAAVTARAEAHPAFAAAHPSVQPDADPA